MRVPRSRLEIAQTHEGKKSQHGWLVINVAGLELEGVSKIHVDLDEVEALKGRRDAVSSRLAELFGPANDDDLIPE